MARRGDRHATPFAAIFLVVLLLTPAPDGASAQLMTQVGDLLLTMSSAVDAYKEFRTVATGSNGRGGRGGGAGGTTAAADVEPASSQPFSVRVLRAAGTGGPVYDWRSTTDASAPNLTVAAAGTASVRFTTRYTRSLKAFNPYVVRGLVELRNLDPHGVVVKGPVKVLVTVKRPPSVKTGPESVTTTHLAICPDNGGKAPVTVPPRRKNGNAGVVRCAFEAELPAAVDLMKQAEAAMAAEAEANPTAFAGPPLPINEDVLLGQQQNKEQEGGQQQQQQQQPEAGPRPPAEALAAPPTTTTTTTPVAETAPIAETELPKPPAAFEAAPKPLAIEADLLANPPEAEAEEEEEEQGAEAQPLADQPVAEVAPKEPVAEEAKEKEEEAATKPPVAVEAKEEPLALKAPPAAEAAVEAPTKAPVAVDKAVEQQAGLEAPPAAAVEQAPAHPEPVAELPAPAAHAGAKHPPAHHAAAPTKAPAAVVPVAPQASPAASVAAEETPVDFDAVASGIAPADPPAPSKVSAAAAKGAAAAGDGMVRAAGLLDSLLKVVAKPPPPGPAPLINAAAAEALVPEVVVSVQATPATGLGAVTSTSAAVATGPGAAAQQAAATSAPLKALFEVPEKACVVVSEVLSGPLAKYIIPGASSLPSGARTVCGPGATLSYDAQLGGFDASACGANTLSTTANPFSSLLGGSAATVNVDVIGCNKTRIARPDIAISRLTAVRQVSSTWSAEAAVHPADASAGAAALHLPAKGVANARYGLRLVRRDAEPEWRLQGELKITTGSLVPEVLPVARLAITTPDGATRHVDARCPPTVVVMSSTCRFDVPWPAGGSGSVQAQLKTIAARSFDVHSGTPKPFDFGPGQVADTHVGRCLTVERAYAGHSALNHTSGPSPERPLVNLVTGVDALLGAVNVDLSRYGLPGSSVSQLLGLQPGAAAPGAGALLSAARDVAAATSAAKGRALLQDADAEEGEFSFDDNGGEDGAASAEALWGDAGSSSSSSSSSSSAWGGGRGGGSAVNDAAGAEAAAKARAGLLPYLHPTKIVSGSAPAGAGARVPMTVCRSANVTWTEQFGGAAMEDCGAMYNALSSFTLATNDTSASHMAPIHLNASLPVVVSGCDLRPAVKLVGLKSAASRLYQWTASARAHDRAVSIPSASYVGPAAPGAARFTVDFERSNAPTGNFTLEPALLLLNPFAKQLAVKGVYASVAVKGLPAIVTRLGCMGGKTSELTLPAAKDPSSPVPVGCVGSVQLPGPTAGTLSIVVETATTGNKTSDSAPFDLTGGRVDEVRESPGRCITLEGGFERGSAGGDDVPALKPVQVVGAFPRPGTQLCASHSFTFDALLTATPDDAARSCSYVARYATGAAGRPDLTADAYTLLAVAGCSAAKAAGSAAGGGYGRQQAVAVPPTFGGAGSASPSRPASGMPSGGGGMGGMGYQPQQPQPQPQVVTPALGLSPLRAYNLTRRFSWSAERRIQPRGAALYNAGLVTVDAGASQSFEHVVSFRRSAVPGFSPQHRVAGAVNVTNPSRDRSMTLGAMAVALRRGGAPDATFPLACAAVPGAPPRPSNAAVSLGPGQSVRCTFDVSVGADSRPGTARVVATLSDGRQVASPTSQALSFAGAPNVAAGECAVIQDDFGLQRGPAREGTSPRTLGERPPSSRLGEAPLKACTPREFRMLTQLGPFGRDRCGTYAYGGAATARPIGGGEVASTGGGKAVELVVTGC